MPDHYERGKQLERIIDEQNLRVADSDPGSAPVWIDLYGRVIAGEDGATDQALWCWLLRIEGIIAYATESAAQSASYMDYESAATSWRYRTTYRHARDALIAQLDHAWRLSSATCTHEKERT